MDFLHTVSHSSLLVTANKLESFLIPCPIKYLIHIDCPGCGFQRSVIALLNTDFALSISLYPATIPLLISIICGVLATYMKVEIDGRILKGLYFLTGIVMFMHYVYKIFTGQVI